MIRYLQSVPGRLLAFATAVTLAGGILPWRGEHAGLGALMLVGGLALAFAALALSMEEHKTAAMTAAVALPGVVFAYLAVVMLLVPIAHGLVYVMAVLALLLTAFALRPSLPAGGTRSHPLHPRNA